MQSHIDSIHSPQRTRNTIMKLCMKSVKFHRGIIFWGNRSTLSEITRSQLISQGAENLSHPSPIVWSKIHHAAHSSPTCIAFAEQLHAHDSEDEDDDTEDESEVSESTNGFPHYGDEEVERRPGLGQLEHSQLGEGQGDQGGGGGGGEDVGGDHGGDNCDTCEEDDSEFRTLGKLNSRPV